MSDQPRTAEELVAALDAGLEELSDADRDPRRAVIACWVRLEQAAAAAGTPRHPGDTPTDLVGRLLAEQQVDSGGCWPRCSASTARPGTRPTRSTNRCAARRSTRCGGCAPNWGRRCRLP